ncbi:hypothetical protein SH501x_000298 [Pirellulaceae bacterium SH501]
MSIVLSRWQFSIRNLLLMMLALALFVPSGRLLWDVSTRPQVQQMVTVPNGGTVIIGGLRRYLSSRYRGTRRLDNFPTSKIASKALPIIVSAGPRIIIQEEQETLLVR